MKIIKYPKSNTIKCLVCGCKYEYEQGEAIYYSAICDGNNNFREKKLTLQCPVCGFHNKCECINYDE